ncbi:WD40-repeat-containing domain protein [Pyronema domesticum]|uniref:Pre-mRNA-splicing factor PRP46 n=1 Tax=Pyronema omphalodes (strain CBS 100304) TaxID=1076935 RepID=U4LX01_PYROM|nr:WD40-repeat-containing domain protein [Pyronema domesticum]CCX34168.1 Similar to Pre-mRNA-splicing factor prp46; acc. no. Q5BE22 [Pyronema omphalodes CBS 100304]
MTDLLASAESLVLTSAKRTRALFSSDFANPLPDTLSHKSHVTTKVRSEYESVRELPPALAQKLSEASGGAKKRRTLGNKTITSLSAGLTAEDGVDTTTTKLIEGIPSSSGANSMALSLRPKGGAGAGNGAGAGLPKVGGAAASTGLVRKEGVQQVKPTWHAPWKLMRVISGHLGWVRAVTVEPGNQWFATGAGDRTIKIWDLASGSLKLTLTGHISTVRGLAVSPRHPYMFSCGEDKMVKCWDLESNRVIRHYHGHLSGVYSLALHPTLDVLVTAGRDGVARVWDMRTRTNVMVLGGHQGTISSLITQEADPQIITGSMDSTIRLWDLAAGKSMAVLTHHKKSVRALCSHPKEFTFASGSADNIKQWKCPEGAFMQNFTGAGGIINTLSVNEDDVMFSGADNGEMCFFDWKSGYRYQRMDTTAQPGSLDAEQGVFCSTFDKTGLRLITGEADKTIKIWKQDENATEETHPMDWKPTLQRQRMF